ncbi:MAG: ATP-binding protein [Planctomycetia bacterium]|nr:ATP-binding protein [Planctomycetia bacterium]
MKNMFDFSTGWLIASGVAAGSLIASFWPHLCNGYQQLVSRVVMTIRLGGYEAEAMQCYLKSRFTASKWGPRAYLAWMLHVRPLRRVQLVPMEVCPPAGRLYWRGWRPAWLCRSAAAGREAQEGITAHEYDQEHLSLSFIRGSFDADTLVIEATQWFNRQVVENHEAGGRRHYIKHIFGTAGRLQIQHRNSDSPATQPSSRTDIRGCLQYRPLIWSFSDLGPEDNRAASAIDGLALTPAALDLVQEARRWKAGEHWYRARKLPWRRGWLLHGVPGTGKTALARAVAEDLDLPVFAYDLASLYNNELQQEWSKILAEVPCLALIEDIDAVFDQRQNVSSSDRQHLTYDCLLNCLDGVERADGLFVVITTNRLDRIDVALGLPDEHGRSTRPGRIDRILKMEPLDEMGRRKIAARVLSESPQAQEAVVREGRSDTGAQFQERCAQLALRLYFDDQNPTPVKATAAAKMVLADDTLATVH